MRAGWCVSVGSMGVAGKMGWNYRSMKPIDFLKIDLQNELSLLAVPVPQSRERI